MISLSFYLILTFFLKHLFRNYRLESLPLKSSPSYRKPCPFGNIF
nr:MAG TPA: hypothetical protein [Caudoviricetes sp.]